MSEVWAEPARAERLTSKQALKNGGIGRPRKVASLSPSFFFMKMEQIILPISWCIGIFLLDLQK